jgi:hypothetical protein
MSPMRRELVWLAGILIAGAVAALVLLWRPWTNTVDEAGAYVEKVGTGEFRSYRRLDQSIKFNSSDCTLRITEHWWQKKDPSFVERTQGWHDYTTVATIHLGSLRKLDLAPGFANDADNQGPRPVPISMAHAYYVSLSTDNSNAVKRSVTFAKNDASRETAEGAKGFHIVSEKPIAEFTDALLYLDHWCGNPKTLDRSESSTPDGQGFMAR